MGLTLPSAGRSIRGCRMEIVDPRFTQPERIRKETVKVRDILSVKGTAVFSIAADATLPNVAAKLVECRVGSLLIFHVDRDGNPGELAGIVTKRNILYACRRRQAGGTR